MQQCYSESKKPSLIDVSDDFQGQSNPGAESTSFQPKPPSRDQTSLLRRTLSNPEGCGSIRLPSLRLGKTMKMPFMTVKSRALDPITTTTDLEARLKPPKIRENRVEGPLDSTSRDQNSGHKKLERSQTAPMTILKPILKKNPEDLRGKIMARTPEKRRQNNLFSNRMIKEGISSDTSESRTASPIMKVLPNGRKIVSRTVRKEGMAKNMYLQNKCALPRNDNTGIDVETYGLDLQCEILKEEGFAAVSDRMSEDLSELTYLTFAKDRQEESNRI